MAKLKIKTLFRENQLLKGRLDDITAAMAVMAHREGGTLELTRKELLDLPDAKFTVHRGEDSLILTLDYEVADVIQERDKVDII